MDILKSKHKEVVSLHNPWHSAADVSRASQRPGRAANYKLTRTFSETETQNFDADTGHRLFRDGRARRKQSRTSSPMRRDSRAPEQAKVAKVAGSTPASPKMAGPVFGLEDEYVPDLDFSCEVRRWNAPSADVSLPSSGSFSGSLGSFSRDGSFLDLNKLHAQVAPQPIQFKKSAFRKAPSSSSSPGDPKKRRSSPKDVSFDAVLASLPDNFHDMPYSQRKRMVRSISASIDYAQFAQFARSAAADSVPKNGSFVRRSRRNSANTVAGRLLAMSSTDVKREPKRDVDEKGAFVMDYQLGRVIGFGAWGIIRECTKDGDVKAVKIVKATPHNPKVLQVFRKEIAIWKQLHHRNILPLLASLETADAVFCLTNRIGGGTLFDVVSGWGLFNEGVENTSGPVKFDLATQRQRVRSTARYVTQIVRALVYLHEQLGVVHGDIKLENVLVDDSDHANVQMVLCDFGMSRVYLGRSRGDSGADRGGGSDSRGFSKSSSSRSKSSFASMRRPMDESPPTFLDDSKIGVQLRRHGCQLAESRSLVDFHEYKAKDQNLADFDADLPHSHIGSLPYASPELLSPSPPPLGPSADVWALGVLVFTMLVGKLPFQHPYEPRLRAMIMAGRYDRQELRQAALVEDVFSAQAEAPSSMVDLARRKRVEELRAEWRGSDPSEFRWVVELVEGCMARDILGRWALSDVKAQLPWPIDDNE